MFLLSLLNLLPYGCLRFLSRMWALVLFVRRRSVATRPLLVHYCRSYSPVCLPMSWVTSWRNCSLFSPFANSRRRYGPGCSHVFSNVLFFPRLARSLSIDRRLCLFLSTAVASLRLQPSQGRSPLWVWKMLTQPSSPTSPPWVTWPPFGLSCSVGMKAYAWQL